MKIKFTGLTLLALLLLVLSWTVTGFAQLNTGKIEGTVRDRDTGAPLAGSIRLTTSQ